MKILAIIAMGLLTIITFVLFLLSSTCALVANVSWGVRALGAVFALVFLGATIALVKKIEDINAKP